MLEEGIDRWVNYFRDSKLKSKPGIEKERPGKCRGKKREGRYTFSVRYMIINKYMSCEVSAALCALMKYNSCSIARITRLVIKHVKM